MATLGAENPYRVYNVAGTALGPFSTASGGGGFTYQDPHEVLVIIQRPGLPPLTLPYLTGYTLTPAAPSTETSGGTVSLTALPDSLVAWPAGAQVCLVRMALKAQPYDLNPTLSINQTALRKRLDGLTRQSQDRARDVLRAVAAPFGEIGPLLPALSVRAGKIGGFDEAGDWVTNRSFVAFDRDVVNTEAARAAAVVAKNLAENAYGGAQGALESVNNALDAVILLADNVDAATLESIEAIAQNYQNVRDALTAREVSSLGAIDDAKTTAQDAIAADKADAQEAVAADKAAAEAAAIAAEAALGSITDLPDRVTVLENAGLAASWTLGLSINTAVAEVGSTVAVTLSRSTNQALTSASINNGVGAVALTVGTVGGYAGGNITANTTWTLTATTTYGAGKTATASLVFRSKRYWGVTTKAPGTAVTDADLLGLASNEFATSYSKSGMVFDCTGGRYPVCAWPAALGVPTEIFVGGFASSDFTIDTQDHVNASGTTVSYKILRLNTLQNGNAVGVTI